MPTVYRDCDLGPGFAGQAGTVGYAVYDSAGAAVIARTTAGVVALGQGRYGAAFSVDSGFQGTVVWDTTSGGPVSAAEGIDLIGVTAPSAADVADAVWDEARTGHTTAGTFGLYLDAQVSTAAGGPTAAQVADAVLDELLSGHSTSGSLGWYVTSIKAKTDLITTGAVTVTSPVAADGTTVTLYQGDWYDDDDAAGRVVTWSSADWPVLTGGAVSLYLPYAATSIAVGSPYAAREVRWEPNNTVTAALPLVTSAAYFLVAVLANGHPVTLLTGRLTVKRSRT
jgi:hypothetical protein